MSLVSVVAFAGVPVAQAAPPVGASDSATPVYVSSATASSVNKMDCSLTPCTIVMSTRTMPAPCTYEIIAVSGVGTPALLYPSTYCTVRIEGSFDSTSSYYLGQSGGPCVFDPASVKVSFSSGANSLFSGSFFAIATFKPTTVDTTLNVRSAVITVKGGSQFPFPSSGRGAINASFKVAFNSTGYYGVGLDRYCHHSEAVGLTTVADGSLSVSF
jgi:hypothetical protein